jgi:HNH endonuclease/NUMOD4 motif
MSKVEVWKEVPGFPSYEVSDMGNVRSWKLKNGRGIAKSPSLLKPSSIKGKKYLRVTLLDDGKVVTWKVHRLVLLAFVGECPEGMEGCHNNGDATDNRLENLRWGTKESNVKDIETHGNLLTGDKHPNSLIPEEDVPAIMLEIQTARKGLSKTYSGVIAKIASRYGVSRACIYNLKKRKALCQEQQSK